MRKGRRKKAAPTKEKCLRENQALSGLHPTVPALSALDLVPLSAREDHRREAKLMQPVDMPHVEGLPRLDEFPHLAQRARPASTIGRSLFRTAF